jgi:hypothetical protein
MRTETCLLPRHLLILSNISYKVNLPQSVPLFLKTGAAELKKPFPAFFSRHPAARGCGCDLLNFSEFYLPYLPLRPPFSVFCLQGHLRA